MYRGRSRGISQLTMNPSRVWFFAHDLPANAPKRLQNSFSCVGIGQLFAPSQARARRNAEAPLTSSLARQHLDEWRRPSLVHSGMYGLQGVPSKLLGKHLTLQIFPSLLKCFF